MGQHSMVQTRNGNRSNRSPKTPCFSRKLWTRTEEANPELEELQHRKQCMWPICEWDPCVPVAVGMAEWWLRLKVVVDLDHPFHPLTSGKKVSPRALFRSSFGFPDLQELEGLEKDDYKDDDKEEEKAWLWCLKSKYEYPICLWMNVDDTHTHTHTQMYIYIYIDKNMYNYIIS